MIDQVIEQRGVKGVEAYGSFPGRQLLPQVGKVTQMQLPAIDDRDGGIRDRLDQLAWSVRRRRAAILCIAGERDECRQHPDHQN
jgi:hypothetical protein